MTDPLFYTGLSAMALAATGIISFVALKGWRDWISLKREELQMGTPKAASEEASPTTYSRIEVADLKERVRKLEAIAAGVDL